MASGDKIIRIEEDEVDRISELPVNLREHILDCMSIADAVATSVLSSKWRYCWTGLRKLKFDNEFWDFGGDSTFLEHARVIDRVLLLHSGPIREFTLFIPEIENKTVDINMWLRVLSNNGVEKIEIDADGYRDNPFPIPSCLFHCRELEKLSLRVCTLRLPTDFKGFANLTSLSLYHVDITPSLLESLVSGCQLLETLSLEKMLLEEPLALEALNLKTFYFNDYYFDSIIFKDTPKLTCVSLMATDPTDRIDTPQPYRTLERLSSLPMIKELTFAFFLLEPLPENLPSSTPTPLENLKCLTLRSLHWEYGDSFRINEEEQEAAAKLLKSETQKHTSYESVQSLKIIGILGVPSEILLIKLLQTRCQNVKRIITEPCLWKLDAATEMMVQEKP
ncbi:unnamed protein product [Rhodiola kirilowii]